MTPLSTNVPFSINIKQSNRMLEDPMYHATWVGPTFVGVLLLLVARAYWADRGPIRADPLYYAMWVGIACIGLLALFTFMDGPAAWGSIFGPMFNLLFSSLMYPFKMFYETFKDYLLFKLFLYIGVPIFILCQLYIWGFWSRYYLDDKFKRYVNRTSNPHSRGVGVIHHGQTWKPTVKTWLNGGTPHPTNRRRVNYPVYYNEYGRNRNSLY
jgi:hypothetical protein